MKRAVFIAHTAVRGIATPIRALLAGAVVLLAACAPHPEQYSPGGEATFEVTSQSLSAAPGESVVLQLRAVCPYSTPVPLNAAITGVDITQWAVTGRRALGDPSTSLDPSSGLLWHCDRPGNVPVALHTGFYELTFTARATARPATHAIALTLSQNTANPGTTVFPRQLQITASRFDTNLLLNPTFDEPVVVGGLPDAPANWRGDLAASVAAEAGIVPRSGAMMLHFQATGGVGSTNTVASQQWQIVDVSALRADIDAGRVRADAGAWFNRVVGGASTDRRFDLRLHAYSGLPTQLPASYVNPAGVRLAERVASLDSIGAVWQQASLSLALPPGTTYLLVEINAFEDVRNDDGAVAEFDGHYADDISLVLVRN